MGGIESIIPPVTAVLVALVSKRVSLALFGAIWLGGILSSGGNPVAGLDLAFTWIVEVMTDEWNARFLLLIALLGSGAAFVHKTGGSHALALALAARIRTREQAQLLPYALGLLVFFNDYANTVIVGNATRDIAAKHRISTEKLAYLIDSTAAPVATLAPVSDWIGYQVAVIAGVFAASSIANPKPYIAFLASIPWNFYCILTIAAVPMIILIGKDFGPMRRAEQRAMSSGRLVAEGDTPLSDVDGELGDPFDLARSRIWHFVLPLVALVAATAAGLWISAGGASVTSIAMALEKADVSYALLWGASMMTLTGMTLAVGQKVSLRECEHVLLLGFRTMLPALVIMVLAWSIGAACKALGTADYIMALSKAWMAPAILPLLVFAVAGAISFATGTSWGAMAIVTPIAVPVAYSLVGADGGLALVHMAIGATFAGAVFGDHCSPVSDTTVMSSIFSGADHVAHVNTQIPYALVPAAISAVLYCFVSVSASPLLLLSVGLIAQFFMLRFLANRPSSRTDQRHDALPSASAKPHPNPRARDA